MASAFPFLLSVAAGAQTATPAADEPAAIRYTGYKDQLLQFDVHLTDLPARSLVRLYDAAGTILHEESVGTGNLNKRYKVGPYLSPRLRFEVTGRGYSFRKTFDVALQLEEKLVVTAAL